MVNLEVVVGNSMNSPSSNENQLTAQQNQLVKHATNIHKFGGSSLATVECIQRVVDIIRQHCQLHDIVVVSANGDTTDALFTLLQLAREESEALAGGISALEQSQLILIDELLNGASAARLASALTSDITLITKWLKENPKNKQADILAFGELWSARLLSSVLSESVCPSQSIDSRDFLVINNEKSGDVDYSISSERFNHLKQENALTVVTGYICKDSQGETCTLGRNGSDYSATIMAALMNARNVTLWTDVDGIYSADPRVVPHARKLNRLHSGVARELGRLGNPVLHAKTLKPLTKVTSHLHVASSFAPDVPGTEIGQFGQIAKQELSVTFLNDLLLVESESLLGEECEKAARRFEAICLDAERGQLVIKQSQQKPVSQWIASHDTEVSFMPASIIAAVGHKVVEQRKIKARFKRAVKRYGYVSVIDSPSGHSLIAILKQSCSIELLNNVHHLMTKGARHIGLVVAGLGNIGERFLEMLPAQLKRVSALENLHLVGLVSSTRALIDTDGIEVEPALEQFKQAAAPYDNEALLSWLANHPYDELIVVDITPSEDFSSLYEALFEQGIHVIGANKWAASSDRETFSALNTAAAKSNSLWMGNTTVGAGLPINFAIDDLIKSGDSITEISGIFSGTLSWLFEKYDGKEAFSSLVKQALALGLTEPDPREDLSGRDVQRKLLILARLAGFELSLEDIDRQDLVPEHLQSLSKDEFLAQSGELDGFFAKKLELAEQSNSAIRYVASFSAQGNKIISADVKLVSIDKLDALATLTPCDNIFVIKSLWYQENPLIIRGPGAGRDVTAGGLHSDLVAICQQLVNRTTQVSLESLS